MKHASTAMKALALSFALSLAPINGAWAQGNAVKGTVVGDDGSPDKLGGEDFEFSRKSYTFVP